MFFKRPRFDEAFTDLLGAISRSSFTCADTMRLLLKLDKKEASEKLPLISFEYICFFVHLINRMAHATLSPAAENTLMERLGPAVVTPFVTTFIDHWPREWQERITGELYERLNEAQIEYGKCPELLTRDAFTGNGVITQLALNVAALAGYDELSRNGKRYPPNPEVHMVAIEACTRQMKANDFRKLVANVGRSL
jgi:hypothetical protein